VLSLQKPGQIIVEVNGDRYNSLALLPIHPKSSGPLPRTPTSSTSDPGCTGSATASGTAATC
jgi:hypothetical protein